jgi:hypothetical protein
MQNNDNEDTNMRAMIYKTPKEKGAMDSYVVNSENK